MNNLKILALLFAIAVISIATPAQGYDDSSKVHIGVSPSINNYCELTIRISSQVKISDTVTINKEVTWTFQDYDGDKKMDTAYLFNPSSADEQKFYRGQAYWKEHKRAYEPVQSVEPRPEEIGFISVDNSKDNQPTIFNAWNSNEVRDAFVIADKVWSALQQKGFHLNPTLRTEVANLPYEISVRK
jgi:hypothetical protein